MEVNSTVQINMKDGQQRDKRTLLLTDESYKSISLTLWGEACHALDFQTGQIIAFKNCRVSDFLGKSLSSSSNPKDCVADPNHKRWIELKKFIGSKKLSGDSQPIQARYPIGSSKESLLQPFSPFKNLFFPCSCYRPHWLALNPLIELSF